jgi:alpha-tubulin suppressor-like RCC1 family protein
MSAITADNKLYSWGANNYGQIGNGLTVNASVPTQEITGGTTWKQVACGFGFTAAIKTDGTLWAWGSNANGQLGDNTVVPKSSPVQTMAGGAWKQVACGQAHMAAIKTDGTLWLWGYNGSGCLGDNTVVSKSSAVQTITGGTTWKQVSCSGTYTAAVKTDGTLWLWGPNFTGNLGTNTTVGTSSPVQTITGGTTWKQVSCNSGNGYYFDIRGSTAAVKTDGTLWMWGSNAYGQLGDNTIITRSSPVQTVSGGTNWHKVSNGSSTTAAIKQDGTLWMWGDNNLFIFQTQAIGMLGDDTTVDKSSPVQTFGGKKWSQVTCGWHFTGAIQQNI